MEPKIQWVNEIHDYRDAGISKGFWKKVVDFLAGEEDTSILKPYGVFADGEGRIFIVDTGAAKIHLLDVKNKKYSTLAGGGGEVFRTPIGITGDENGSIYITDSANRKVYRYNLNDQTLRVFTPTTLLRPTGIAFNKESRTIYVTDTMAQQVIAFDMTGIERFRFGGRGEAPGLFNYPTDLTVDGRGRVYVTDSLNSRVQIFSAEGVFEKTFGEAGDTAGRFAKAKGVAVDSDGNIYVCDALLDAVQIFDEEGQLLFDLGGSGGDAGQFWMPTGIYIDKNNYIYVGDSYNRRVQIFKYLKTGEPPLKIEGGKIGP